MNRQVSHLLAEALRLPEEERGDLVAQLLESFDPGADPDVEAAWGQEIRQRLDDLDTGAVRAVPWPEARRLILEDADDSAGA
jgi:putative addiction module component (TIGR02574 family)